MEDMERSIQTERGQVLVIMVFGIIVLLVVAGLAVDGGTVLMERRHAQNASDASALAGTRLLAAAICDVSSASDAAILAEVWKLAEENDVRNPAANVTAQYVDQHLAVLGTVGGGSIPVGSTGVSVTIEITRATYLMPLIGIDRSAASAHALAMTGPIIRFSGGVLPIAVPLDVVNYYGTDIPFDVADTSQDGAFCHEDGSYCYGDPNDAASKRGWLNLNYIYNQGYNRYIGGALDPFYRTLEKNVSNAGCGPDPHIATDDGLKGWASGQCPYPLGLFAGTAGDLDGDFIHGGTGARASSMSEIEDNFEGKTGYMPVFDSIYTPEDMDYLELEEPVDGIGWPTAGGSHSAFLYHIVGFVGVGIKDVDGPSKTLNGSFVDKQIAKGMFVPNSGYGTGACAPLQIFGVALWE